MAVTEVKNSSILRLKFLNGEAEGGQPKYKMKNIKNLKPEASVENVYQVGKALSGLLEIPADKIAKIDDVDYEESI